MSKIQRGLIMCMRRQRLEQYRNGKLRVKDILSRRSKQRQPGVIKENISTKMKDKVEKNCDVGKNS